ncbi:formin-like protein 3 [Rhodamnia argentea]|uniref:Formin-like protein 3 n=1 Tax=Rhodamnia argentea TaxID=178133 RepID=A0A8B8MSW7_9MYRT|nr:formin-like protein 3 [Rhodamnia argentea]
MGGGEHHRGLGGSAEPPMSVVAPETMYAERQERWTHFDDSVNAVSFGFVATAILISMFLLMAIFERFLRSRTTSSSSSPPPPPTPSDSSPGRSTTRSDVESQIALPQKLHLLSSPKMSVYANGVSVLMPGEQIPTFLAHPAPPPPPPMPPPPPPPCPKEPVSQPLHQQHDHSLHLHCLSTSIGS